MARLPKRPQPKRDIRRIWNGKGSKRQELGDNGRRTVEFGSGALRFGLLLSEPFPNDGGEALRRFHRDHVASVGDDLEA